MTTVTRSVGRIGTRETAAFLGLPLRLRRPKEPVGALRLAGLTDNDVAVARLACSWLLSYPDEALLDRLASIEAAVAELPPGVRTSLDEFLRHLDGSPLGRMQQHFVEVFDMKRRACPFLTYWTTGDTRNRGAAILRFKQAYEVAGFHLGNEELADHLCVLLEFTAVGDKVTGEALLAEHAAPVGLLREALHDLGSVYSHLLDAVAATMPKVTAVVAARMQELAAAGPPVEVVGLEPFVQDGARFAHPVASPGPGIGESEVGR